MLGILRTARATRSLRPLTHTRHFAGQIPPADNSASSSQPTDHEGSSASSNGKAGKGIIPSTSLPALVSETSQNRKLTKSERKQQLIEEAAPKDGQLRPIRTKIAVPEDHGLFAFFKKFKNEDGDWNTITVQPWSIEQGYSGRSWSAPELRRKSFKDLHTLWYILLRERNLLATQKEECRRIGVPNIDQQTDIVWKVKQCRKSMARIKYVINERRLTYDGAVERFAADKAIGKFGAAKKEEAAKIRAEIEEKKNKASVGKGRTGRVARGGRSSRRSPFLEHAALSNDAPAPSQLGATTS